MRLALGTAQFGQDYGIDNPRGRVPFDEVCDVLRAAHAAGVRLLDTAAAYGDSETQIGKAMRETGLAFDVVTKLPAGASDAAKAFERSLERLGLQHVYGYLFHDYATYNENAALIDDMVALRRAGRVERIGVSLYHPAEAEQIIDADAPCDLVQVPYSVFDQRFERVLPALKARGIEVHARSVFLQGLAFMSPDELPAALHPAGASLTALRALGDVSVSCLGYVAANPCIDRMVIGVRGVDDLQRNLAALSAALGVACPPIAALRALRIDDERVLLPYLWPR